MMIYFQYWKMYMTTHRVKVQSFYQSVRYFCHWQYESDPKCAGNRGLKITPTFRAEWYHNSRHHHFYRNDPSSTGIAYHLIHDVSEYTFSVI